jgi:hypothetical protein
MIDPYSDLLLCTLFRGAFRFTLVPPYKPRGTCVTWRTMGNGTFPLILFLLVCLFLGLVGLKMAEKIKGKVT